MLDASQMRPVDAWAVASTAVAHLQRHEWDAAYRVLDLDTTWLEDSTLVEVMRVATARVNEFLTRAGLPPAVMPPDPTQGDT